MTIVVALGVVVVVLGLLFDFGHWHASRRDNPVGGHPLTPALHPPRPDPVTSDPAPVFLAAATAPVVARPSRPPALSNVASPGLFVPGVPPLPVTVAVRPPPAPLPPGGPPLLVCRDVHVAYDKVRVLFGVDMEIRQGEIVALLGTNGAGKSTLLKAISGLVEPIEGSIVFDGRDITRVDPVERARLGIVQVPGGRAVFPTLTVAEHFKAAAWLFAKEDATEVRARTDRIVELFPILKDRWHHMGGNLSGGEQQQLGLGMAFVAKPRLLIIDELSLGLAPAIVEQLLEIVRTIHADEGCPVILVEQSVNVALTIAQRAYFMEKGEVRFEGAAAGLLARGDLLRSVFLEGAAGNGTAAPQARTTAHVSRNGGADPLESQPVVLATRDVSKRFGGIVAVDDVTFELRRGETLGLIGPNGAGKTTVLDLISGVLPVDSGRIELGDIDIGTWSASRRSAAGLGRSFQDARIFRVPHGRRKHRHGTRTPCRHARPSRRAARPTGDSAVRASGRGAGGGAHRVDEPPVLPGQVRVRALYRCAAHRRPDHGHRPQPEGPSSR